MISHAFLTESFLITNWHIGYFSEFQYSSSSIMGNIHFSSNPHGNRKVLTSYEPKYSMFLHKLKRYVLTRHRNKLKPSKATRRGMNISLSYRAEMVGVTPGILTNKTNISNAALLTIYILQRATSIWSRGLWWNEMFQQEYAAIFSFDLALICGIILIPWYMYVYFKSSIDIYNTDNQNIFLIFPIAYLAWLKSSRTITS